MAQAGLYTGLLDLKSPLTSGAIRRLTNGERACELATLIQSQAAELDLAAAEPLWETGGHWTSPMSHITRLGEKILELEYTLIPHGLHVAGSAQCRRTR